MIRAGPETCTSSACPAAEWEKTLSLYSTHLEETLAGYKDEHAKDKAIRAKKRLLGKTWILHGWAGLLHRDRHEIAGKLYQHQSETRSRHQRKVAASTLDDFRRWYASR